MSEMDLFLKEFGKTLKVTRKQMGLSQVSAAQSMHIDYRHYQNIEGGKINLRLDTLIKLVKFYNLDKSGPNFNIEGCLDLLSTHSGQQQVAWKTLCKHFVECGQAGFLSIQTATRTIVTTNDKFAHNVGAKGASDLVGRRLSDLLDADSLAQLDSRLQQLGSMMPLDPFLITVQAQPQTPPVSMMAILSTATEQVGQAELIVFDRRTLDEEGNRLKDLVAGYQQFMKIHPQMKAV